MSNQDEKDALKEALKEWLDEKAASFGWFSIKTFGAVALMAMVYFIIQTQGWHR